jgi:7-cyano-7-deazaguanine reductase
MASTVDHDLPLGKTTDFVETYTPSLLRSIPRMDGRLDLQLGPELPFFGEDQWTCYEFSWLNPKGRPQVAVLGLNVPCTSSHIVESKSLKLYLFSYSQTSFAHRNDVLQTLDSDLSLAFRAPVFLNLYTPEQLPDPVTHLPGRSLDHLDVDANGLSYDAELLQLAPGQLTSRETLYTDLFRCLCPVTGQPDWASIMVQYAGPAIDHESLLRYLISYRHHKAFHESTIEQIYLDIQRRCVPNQLSVFGRFQRRGGIDINPFRSSHEHQAPLVRLVRQ